MAEMQATASQTSQAWTISPTDSQALTISPTASQEPESPLSPKEGDTPVRRPSRVNRRSIVNSDSFAHRQSVNFNLRPHEPIKDAATDRALRRHWIGGAYVVCPKVPHGREQPQHVRELSLLPRSQERPEEVLGRHGTFVRNIKGNKHKNDTSVGQDMFSCAYLGDGWWFDLVADGHGSIGDVVAERICQVLPYFMGSSECSSLLQQRKVEEAYKVAFERTQKDIEDTLSPEVRSLMFSGSTCVCLLRQHRSRTVYVAWVGDSKAILIAPDGTVVKRTLEHKPGNLEERERVTKMGCEVVTCRHDDVELLKVNVKGEEFPAISFTRSFGDQCVKALGVYAVPQVEEWKIPSGRGDSFIFLGSDGIWEFMSEEEVGACLVGALKQGQTSEGALSTVFQESQARWRTHEGDYCDDITGILVLANAPKSQPPVAKPDSCWQCFDRLGCSCLSPS